MHRIASLGDVQESNKNERHVSSRRDAATVATNVPGLDVEGGAALVDFGRVFETVMKYTVVATATYTWQSIAGLYYVVKESDYDNLWEPTCELCQGEP